MIVAVQQELFRQEDLNGAVVAVLVAVITSVWRVQAACQGVDAELSTEQLWGPRVNSLDVWTAFGLFDVRRLLTKKLVVAMESAT